MQNYDPSLNQSLSRGAGMSKILVSSNLFGGHNLPLIGIGLTKGSKNGGNQSPVPLSQYVPAALQRRTFPVSLKKRILCLITQNFQINRLILQSFGYIRNLPVYLRSFYCLLKKTQQHYFTMYVLSITHPDKDTATLRYYCRVLGKS